MTRDEKKSALRHKTSEVDVRYLVTDAHAQAFEEALHNLAKSFPGVIVCTGGWTESPEWHEIEEIVDGVPDEVFDRLKNKARTGQHYNSRLVEGPRALEAAKDFAKLAAEQAGIEFPVSGDETSARINLDEWDADEAFGPWFKEWVSRWDLHVED